MRAVIQRVKEASVTADGAVIGRIGPGMVVLIGISKGDTDEQADALARRCFNLRIFSDTEGKMNEPLETAGGTALVVSQFTLCAATDRGRRPSYVNAAPPDEAAPLYDRFCVALEAEGAMVERGRFGAMMEVALVNDGPVTLILDS